MDNLGRVFKLQKRAARVISDANDQASSVKLLNSLQWLPFYELTIYIYKRMQLFRFISPRY